MEIGLYVHIPFCHAKCNYCDFLSFSSNDHMTSYIEALIKEIKAYSMTLKKEYTIKTIFIGGGTPTVLPPYLFSKLCDAIALYFNLCNDVEWTVEANPGTLTKELVHVFKRYPINRVSLGLQAVQDGILQSLGRIHTFDDWRKSISFLLENDIFNINTDVMFALPSQKLADLEHTLISITQFNIKHLSVYSLIIEEGTPIEKLYEQGKLIMPSEDEDRKMYHFIQSFLASKGYKQYEISNWAIDEKCCKHNILYWKREPYIGIGLGAHSFFEDDRYSNITILKEYICAQGDLSILQENRETITYDKAIEEYMFLGLRLTEGILIKDFKDKFNQDIFSIYNDQLNKWIKFGALIQDKGRIYLSDYGIDISNQVFSSFLQ